jgi:hypothetical protein
MLSRIALLLATVGYLMKRPLSGLKSESGEPEGRWLEFDVMIRHFGPQAVTLQLEKPRE